jgi:hypothetical protein
LIVGGERVPFERVLAHHLDEVTELRSASGLTWRSMASLLARAGARRADGGLISADQLRVGYARLIRHAERPLDRSPRNGRSENIGQRAAHPGAVAYAEHPGSQPALVPERVDETSRPTEAGPAGDDEAGPVQAP